MASALVIRPLPGRWPVQPSSLSRSWNFPDSGTPGHPLDTGSAHSPGNIPGPQTTRLASPIPAVPSAPLGLVYPPITTLVSGLCSIPCSIGFPNPRLSHSGLFSADYPIRHLEIEWGITLPLREKTPYFWKIGLQAGRVLRFSRGQSPNGLAGLRYIRFAGHCSHRWLGRQGHPGAGSLPCT